jgi:hypothetical protein
MFTGPFSQDFHTWHKNLKSISNNICLKFLNFSILALEIKIRTLLDVASEKLYFNSVKPLKGFHLKSSFY